MKKYVLIMIDDPDSPVRGHCAFDALDQQGAEAFARRVVAEGHSFRQAVELMYNREVIARFAPIISVAVTAP